jgi:diketogulonate reductase-like aldo/keto reductase
MRDLGIKREDVFVTSKIVSRNHGYESTLRAVDESLEKMGLGQYYLHMELVVPRPDVLSSCVQPTSTCSLSTILCVAPDGRPSRSVYAPLTHATLAQLSGSRRRLDTYRALVEKVKEGKLRSIGVSNL